MKALSSHANLSRVAKRQPRQVSQDESRSFSPRNQWKHTPKNVYQYLERLRQSGTNHELTKFYDMDSRQFLSARGRGVANIFEGSMALAAMSCYPVHHWQTWRFSRVPRNYWALLGAAARDGDPLAEFTLREYLTDSALHANINPQSREDWIRLLSRQPHATRLASLGSLEFVLALVVPEQSTSSAVNSSILVNSVLESHRSAHYWREPKNRRQFLEQLIKSLGPTDDAAYSLSYRHFYSAAAKGLISQFNNSVVQAIMVEYPERWWKRWQFLLTSSEWYSELQWLIRQDDPIGTTVGREVVLELAAQAGISKLEDWIQPKLLTRKQQRVLRRIGGQMALSLIYPYDPNIKGINRYSTVPRTLQRQLRKRVSLVV